MTIKLINLLLLICIVLTQTIYDDRRICMESVSSCVEVESQPNQLEFTVYGPHSVGYLAVGIKRSENKEDDSVFVAWFDSSGIPNVIEMIGYNFTNPNLVNDTDVQLLSSQSKLLSDRKVITFTHPLEDVSHEDLPFQIVNNSLTMTFVYSDQVPRTRGKYRSTFPNYDIMSTTHVPLLSKPLTPPVMYTTGIILAHAITMMLGWMLFPALGIYVARYLKRLMDVWWFYLHIMFMMVAGILIVFGFTVLAITGPFMWKISAHGLLGCIVGGLFALNFFLGIVIDRMWDPDRINVPVRDKIHWWIGRAVPMMGIVTIGFGIFQLPSGMNRLPWLISFVILIILNMLLFFLNPILAAVKYGIQSICQFHNKVRTNMNGEGNGDDGSTNGEAEPGIQVDYEVEGKKWEHF